MISIVLIFINLISIISYHVYNKKLKKAVIYFENLCHLIECSDKGLLISHLTDNEYWGLKLKLQHKHSQLLFLDIFEYKKLLREYEEASLLIKKWYCYVPELIQEERERKLKYIL